MSIEAIQAWLDANPTWAPWALVGILLVLDAALFFVVRNLLARGLIYLTRRSKSKIDDIIVQHMRPYRFAWIAPLLLTYYLATWFPSAVGFLRDVMLLGVLWLTVITLNGMFTAINVIYEAGDAYQGISIQGYLDLGKLLVLTVGVILTVARITDQSPIALLSGLGAIMAILVLIFHDTLLSFVASLQIQSQDLVREGDWIEMPAYDADGDIVNIALHTIKVRNWNNTITVIPTHKLLNTPYRNWRGMTESGGRRIKRALYVDINSVRFCDKPLLDRLRSISLVSDYLSAHLDGAVLSDDDGIDCDRDICAEHELTNVGVFRVYMTAYLKQRDDLHQDGMTLLVRQLDPGPKGLPLEVYAFTITTAWEAYEAIQAEIFEHLVAAAPAFDLKVFQEPTGTDFRAVIA